MTATVTDNAGQAAAAGGVGRVSRIIGPVVDVEFPADAMPEMYNLLTTEVDLGGEKKNLNLEVAQHIGDNLVRAISLQPTDGVVRGAPVRDTGGPITVPVGDVTLGHVFNATGDVLDLKPRREARDHRALGHPPQGPGLRPARAQDRRCSRPASRSSTC